MVLVISFIVVLGFHYDLLFLYNFALKPGESRRNVFNNGPDELCIELLIIKLEQCVVLLRARPPCIIRLKFLLGYLLGNLTVLLKNVVSNLGFKTLQLVNL